MPRGGTLFDIRQRKRYVNEIMAHLKTPVITVHDYRALPETGPRYQLVEGELHMTPAPSRYHQDISRNIEFILLKYLEEHPIGKIYDAPFDVYLTETNVYQPDILFVSNRSFAILTEQGAEGAPELIVEILSPKTAEIDTGAKRKIYAQTGVTELWIVDPEVKRIYVYYLRKDQENPGKTIAQGETFSSPLFPGLALDTEVIFRD